MKVIQSYLQGARHRAKNQPCEDRTYTLSENGVVVIALADGAGSQKYTHSAEGAACVTETISKFFCNNFDKFYEKDDTNELSTVIMAVCQRALQKKAVEVGVDDIVKMSSTLLAVAVKNDRMIACHIGDGVIGKLTTVGMCAISIPDNGEFANTTYFITSPNANQHIRIIKDKTDNVISYFLMSDGTQEYVYDATSQTFLDSARKMALLSFNSNGQKKLEETIYKYMIDADTASDDCSFVSVLLMDEVEHPFTDLSAALPEIKLDNVVEAERGCADEPTTNETTKSIAGTKKRKVGCRLKIIILLFALACAVIILLSAILLMRGTNRLPESETETTTTLAESSTSPALGE